MGTRHLTCVVYQGRFVVAQYGRCDGYPDGQGLTLVNFLRTPPNIQRLQNGLQHIYEPSYEEVYRVKGQIAEFMRSNADIWLAFVARPSADSPLRLPCGLCPSLSRDTGAGILEVISQATADNKVPVILDLPFINNTWDCEWAYVVDLDKAVLEVFCGAEEKKSFHRFKDVGGDQSTVPICISSFDFSELQTLSESDFLSRVGHDQGQTMVWRYKQVV